VQMIQDLLEQCRLAGAGSAHQVDDRDAGPVEVVAVGARDRVVRVEHPFDDPDVDAVHGYTRSATGSSTTSRDSIPNSSPVATSTSKLPQRAQHSGKASARLSRQHAAHRTRTGTNSIASSAPSASVPPATSSNESASALGATCRRLPTRRSTRTILRPA